MSDNAFSFGSETSLMIRKLWEEKLNNKFISYDPDRGSLTKKIGMYTVNYLPGRLKYLKDNPPKQEIRVDTPHSNKDGFCVLWNDIEKKQKIKDLAIHNFTWRILANISPIERYHCVLIPDGKPRNQTLTLQYLKDLALLAKSDSSITLGFNSFGAAASQNHFHFHLFFNHWSREIIDKMPIERSVFDLDDIENAIMLTDQLVRGNIGHNITMSSEGIVVTKRRNEHVNGIRYGMDAISGRFLTASPKQYQDMTISNINSILEQITYTTS